MYRGKKLFSTSWQENNAEQSEKKFAPQNVVNGTIPLKNEGHVLFMFHGRRCQDFLSCVAPYREHRPLSPLPLSLSNTPRLRANRKGKEERWWRHMFTGHFLSISLFLIQKWIKIISGRGMNERHPAGFPVDLTVDIQQQQSPCNLFDYINIHRGTWEHDWLSACAKVCSLFDDVFF